jgi:hypothetical protein
MTPFPASSHSSVRTLRPASDEDLQRALIRAHVRRRRRRAPRVLTRV